MGLGSDLRDPIPDPGSRGQKGTESATQVDPPGSRSEPISERYGSGSSFRSFPFLIKRLSGLK
jgi:hypothetical protein